MSHAAGVLHPLRGLRRWMLDADTVHKTISVLLMLAGVLAIFLAAVRA